MSWNRRTQVIVLLAGLLVWAGALYWRLAQPAPAPAITATGEAKSEPGKMVEAKSEPGKMSEAHGRAEASPGRRAGPGGRGPGKTVPLPALRLDLLDRSLPPLAVEGKNLFASVLPPPPPPPKAAPAAAAAPPPDPFLEEARKLRVVAVMRENGQDVAFVAEGNEVHSVKKNDVIRSRFLIKDVNDDGVVVSQPDGQKEVRLALTPSGGAAQK